MASLSVGVLFALPEESKPFLRRMGSVSGCKLACSGAGAANAERAAAHLIDETDTLLRCLLICGFAGGLTPEMVPGSLIIANSAIDHTGGEYTGEAYGADSRLLAAVESVHLSGVPIRRGTLATTNRVLITRQEKYEFTHQTPAHAVDMETTGAARIASARFLSDRQAIPWLAVRAITDGMDDELPFDFNTFISADRNIDRSRVIRATLARPWKIPALIRLGARSSRAAGNLAAFLEVFLQNLPE
jgi:nucleoside phosphorylase